MIKALCYFILIVSVILFIVGVVHLVQDLLYTGITIAEPVFKDSDDSCGRMYVYTVGNIKYTFILRDFVPYCTDIKVRYFPSRPTLYLLRGRYYGSMLFLMSSWGYIAFSSMNNYAIGFVLTCYIIAVALFCIKRMDIETA